MVHNNKFRKRNVFQKYGEVFFTRLFLTLKEAKEYKAQVYNLLFLDLFLILIYFLFFEIYRSLVGDLIGWSLEYFIIFNLYLMLFAKLRYFHLFYHFSSFLKKGDLNQYLVRPISSYFMTSLRHMGGGMITILPIFIIVIFALRYFNFGNIWISLLIAFFGEIYYIIFIAFININAFFIKENEFLEILFERKLNFAIEQYTPKLFYETNFKYIAFLLPSAIYGFFAVEALNGKFDLLLYFLPYILISFFVMLFGIILMWHYGLKKYEAFG